MESAQELEAATGWNEETTRPVVIDAGASREWTASGRGFRVLLALQVVALAALIAGVLVVRNLVIDARHEALAQHEATAAKLNALSGQLTALHAQQDGVEKEVSAVRQLVASHTGEDVIFLKMMVLKPTLDPELARRIARSVHQYCTLYHRDPDLALAIMTVESDFNPKAESPAGAVGLMQVMPHWKKVLGIQGDLRDPEVSIQYGLQVLGFYQEMYKDTELALTAYNRGPGPVDNALVKGRDPRNGYAPRVLQVYERLKKLNGSAEKM
ncbi:MAG: transglycosylase SLT domain-containing protein [Myxococcaceae bacterium]|nr:transglycosylase SLT domain-containing protein [Myxococcaceae bacterium]